jgi:hypothetical protein
MWSIQFRKGETLGSIQIDADDVIFFAVMKRGPTMHIRGKTAVKCTHIAEHEHGTMEISMNLLDATYVEHLNEEFCTLGVMGVWKLLKPVDTQYPTMKLERIVNNADDFLAEAKSSSNPSWVREAYKNL